MAGQMAFCSPDCRLSTDVVVNAFLQSLRSIRRPSGGCFLASPGGVTLKLTPGSVQGLILRSSSHERNFLNHESSLPTRADEQAFGVCSLSIDCSVRPRSSCFCALLVVPGHAVCTPFPASIYPKDPLTLDNNYSAALCDSLLLLRLLNPTLQHPPGWLTLALPLSSHSKCLACGNSAPLPLSRSSSSPAYHHSDIVPRQAQGLKQPLTLAVMEPEVGSPAAGRKSLLVREGGQAALSQEPAPSKSAGMQTRAAHTLSLTNMGSLAEAHLQMDPNSSAAQLLHWLLSSRRTLAVAGGMTGRSVTASCQLHPHAADFFQRAENQPQHCFRVKGPEDSGDASFWEGQEEGPTSAEEVPHRCSFLAFHGTSSENMHSILRCGLLRLSGTGLQQNGSMHGAGIYLSTDPGVALSFCKAGDTMASLPDTSFLQDHDRRAGIEPSTFFGAESPAEWVEETLRQHSSLGPSPLFLLTCQVYFEDGVLRGPVCADHAPSCIVCGKDLRLSAGGDSGEWKKAVSGLQGLSRKQNENMGSYVLVDSPSLVVVRSVLVYSQGRHKGVQVAVPSMGLRQLSAIEQASGDDAASTLQGATLEEQQARRLRQRSQDPCRLMLLAYVVVLVAVALKHSPWATHWFDWLALFWSRPAEEDFW